MPESPASTGSILLGPTRPQGLTDDGDHERMAHIVLEGFRQEGGGEFLSVGTSVAESIVTGTPVRALCGKVWVPNRDPDRYPLCPTCKEVAEAQGWTMQGL